MKMMQRAAMDRLVQWMDASDRKPLIIYGVRRVGKTRLMRAFASEYFSGKAHYFNFEENPHLGGAFDISLSPKVILEELAFRSGKKIEPGSLLIFDEVQNCPEAIHALKYFCELRPDLRILAAQSLQGLSVARPKSFPVGKVDVMVLDPLTFTEFLSAQNEIALVEMLKTWDRLENFPELEFKHLSAKLNDYTLVGGMPEAVAAWCLENDLAKVQTAQKLILESCIADIESHAKAVEIPKIKRVWGSLVSQLSRENNQFRYSLVEERSNARKYGDSLQWLIDARIVRSVHRLKGLGIPLSGYAEASAFKIYMVDCGLLASLAKIDPETLLEDNPLFKEIKGSLTENLVLQSLVSQMEDVPNYWAISKPGAEVDFVIAYRGRIIPIEVKSSSSISSPSLKKFKEIYGDLVQLRVRFSMRNLSLDGDILNIPLFMADQSLRLIDLALKR